MTIKPTISLRTGDPLGRKKRDDLYHLIVLAGGIARLAKLLGYDSRATWDWRRRGQLPAMAALLVDSCPELSWLFRSEYLRPDVSDDKWYQIKQSQKWKEHYQRQREFFRSSDYFDGSPINSIEEITGLQCSILIGT